MPRKILVVDDERHIVRLVEINLQRAGYDVVTAYDGVEALEKVRTEKPNLITTCIDMPRMDGYELLGKLQSDPATVDIPVIFLTKRATDADIFKGWQSGCSSYLTKPFNPRELLAFVEVHLGRLDGDGGTADEIWEA